MTKKRFIYVLWTLSILSLLAACVPAVEPTPDEAARQPFSLHIAGEDGAEVTWESYTEGFLPGTTETMHLAAQNNTDQHWDGRLCVQLLEPVPSSVVISLTQQDFSLESGGGFARDVSVDLPADLVAGTYGLALVVHQPTGPVVDVIPVQVGEGTREPFQGEWPTEAALAACPAPQSHDEGPATQPVLFREGFEAGLAGWEAGADVPQDPANPGQPVFWSIERSADQASEGASSARFTLDGKQDDGTIWLARPFEVAGDVPLRVRLTFDLWSESESFNTLAYVAAYAGPRPPTVEEDFDLSQTANQVTGWKTYTYDLRLLANPEGPVWVALGISAVWETEMTYYVDNVHVEIVPAEGGQAPGGRITVEGVEVSETTVVVRGKSTLPDGTCVSAELWADGAPQAWWPVDLCAPVRQGAWELVTPLPEGEALRPGVQYMVRAYQPGGPNIVATFPFDLDALPLPPTQEPADDPTLLLPDSAELLAQASGDLDGDGAAERVFLAGFGGSPDRLGYDFLDLFVLTPSTSPQAVAGYELVWHSEALAGDRAESLEVRDINGDGRLEVLCLQAMGAAGETLQIVVWSEAGYGLLRPRGGYFDGREAFGENGVCLEDVDGDGLVEILAGYGPAAESTDVYGWDRQAYTYRHTLSASPAGYTRVDLTEAGLSLEIPTAWTQIDAATWVSPEDDAMRLGVRWAILEPPQEPEAVLLPTPSQIIHSEPVELSWASGRSFTVEVYAPAAQGGDTQAPVQSVETHMLIVVSLGDTRRAFDFFASGQTAEQLNILAPSLQHMLETSILTD
ncbi:MAG: VCBS repeat-containing protein [Clostridia bacterium]|nr:VCBS repeat-containing protein [Clostridia bacterium]